MVLFADAGPDRAVVLPSRIVSAVMPISVWGGGPAGAPPAANGAREAANATERFTPRGHGTRKEEKGPMPFRYLSRSVLYWAMPASLVSSLVFGSFRYRAEIMPSTGDELPTFLITDRQVVVLAATWFI